MQLIDKKLLFKRRAQKRVSSLEALKDNQFLLNYAEDDLLDRLKIVMREFEFAAHLGGYNGSFTKRLIQDRVAENVFNFESNPASLNKLSDNLKANFVIAEDEALPLKTNSMSLITSSLHFQFINDLPGLMRQIYLSLKPDGLLMANMIGGTSLYQLKEALLMAETEINGGASMRVMPFVNVQQMGALLQRAGFKLPVVDLDVVTVNYDHIFALIKDLRAMGATNPMMDASKNKPLTRAIITRAAEIYTQEYSKKGRVEATFEIINISGWRDHESQQKPLAPGSAKRHLSEIL